MNHSLNALLIGAAVLLQEANGNMTESTIVSVDDANSTLPSRSVQDNKYPFSEEEKALLATLSGKPKKLYVKELKKKYGPQQSPVPVSSIDADCKS